MAQEQVLAAADRRRRGLADVAHRVHVLRRHRLLEKEQLEGLGFLCHALAGRHVVAAVHVDGEIDALVERAAHEGDLLHHVIDLGVARRPVHRRPSGADRSRSSMSILTAVKPMSRMPRELRLRLRIVRDPRSASRSRRGPDPASCRRAAGRPAVPAPCRPGPRARSRRALRRRHVLAGLRPGEDADRADALEERVDVERVLADQGAPEHAGRAARRRGRRRSPSPCPISPWSV